MSSEGQGIHQSHVRCREPRGSSVLPEEQGGRFSNTTDHKSRARVSRERCHRLCGGSHIRGQAGSGSRRLTACQAHSALPLSAVSATAQPQGSLKHGVIK